MHFWAKNHLDRACIFQFIIYIPANVGIAQHLTDKIKIKYWELWWQLFKNPTSADYLM